MRKLSAGVCIFLFLGLLSASLFGYEYIMSDHQLSWNLGFVAAGTKITALTGGNWNFGYFDLTLPAANQFYFYGKKVTHVRIHTKGYVTFGFGSAPSDSTTIPLPSLPNPILPNGFAAPFLDDFDLSASGEMYYTLGGTYTTIEWRNVPLWNHPGTTYTFEVALCTHNHYICPNLINFAYAKVSSGVAAHDYGTQALVGIEHPQGTQGEEYSAYTASLAVGKSIYFTPFVPVYGGTYDIFGTSNIPVMTVWRPSNGVWYYRLPDGPAGATQWGTKSDIPLPGDWNGDGKAEPCVLRPSTYVWWCPNPAFAIQWGTDGDIPVPADYDGAGQLDIAVFRAGGAISTPGTWFIYHRHSGAVQAFQWGTQGDIPMPADYDNDGKADLAVYRPASNTWFIRKSSNPAQVWVVPWGTEGDVPMAVSWASVEALGIFRPSNGTWWFKRLDTGDILTHQWGADGDEPVPCDQDLASGSETIVFRPQNGLWFISFQASFTYPQVTPWGTLGDKPRFRRSFGIIAPPGNVVK